MATLSAVSTVIDNTSSFLVVGGAGVAVVQGGSAVPRAGYARVTHVAAPARVVAVVHEGGLALVLLHNDEEIDFVLQWNRGTNTRATVHYLITRL